MRTALKIERDLRINEWKRLGELLAQMLDSAQWWIGDWWRYGVERFGDDYDEALAQIRNRNPAIADIYARVARLHEEGSRVGDLSWQHHRVVAAISRADERSEWLSDAFDLGWSDVELRSRIREWVASGQLTEGPAEATGEGPSCTECGGSLENKRHGAITCSPRCRQRRKRRIS